MFVFTHYTYDLLDGEESAFNTVFYIVNSMDVPHAIIKTKVKR